MPIVHNKGLQQRKYTNTASVPLEMNINEFHKEADGTLDRLCEKYEIELEDKVEGDFDSTFSVRTSRLR